MLRIAYLYPKKYYETKMSFGRVLYGNALGNLPDVDLQWSGIGWDGYDDSKTVTQNLGELDAVWVYKGEGLKGLEEIPVRVVTFNEANHAKTLEEIEQAKSNLVVFHHENDIQRWNLNCKTAHILHSAEHFSKNPNKTVDCLVAGVVSEQVYPLRTRLFRLVQSGMIQGKIRRHPGYRLSSHAACRSQYNEYIDELASAKILLTCTSVYKYPLAKIMEAMALGAVVVSDMPNDRLFQDVYGDCIVEINNEMSDEEIVSVVNNLLEDKNRLESLSRQSHDAAIDHSAIHYAERLRDEIKKVLLEKSCK